MSPIQKAVAWKPVSRIRWPIRTCVLPPGEDALIPTVCSSLDQALEALDTDREFLTRGGVFSNVMIDAYIELKMQEVQRFRMAPHPVEYDMYYSL